MPHFELLLPIGQRWPWRTSRSVRGTVNLRHSRLTWQWRLPWCRLIRRANGSHFTLARPPDSAVHSPLRNSCLIKKVVPKRIGPCPSVVLGLSCQDPLIVIRTCPEVVLRLSYPHACPQDNTQDSVLPPLYFSTSFESTNQQW